MSTETFRPNRCRAFSLIEIMVAVTLLTVITVGLLAMFYHTQRAFKIGTSQVDVLEGGRAALRIIALDLQEMYPSRDNNVTNFHAMPSSGARISMPLPDNQVMNNLIQDVAFLTRRGNEWFATAYRVDHANGAGTLYRAVVRTDLALIRTNQTLTPTNQLLAVSNAFARVTQRFVAPYSITNTPPDSGVTFDRIADGIVHFRMHAYNDRGIRLNTNSAMFPNGFERFWFTNWVPEYIEVELGFLDPKGMTQFRAREGVSDNARRYLEGQGYRTHVFHERVQIRSRREEFDIFALK
jgi:prepilin-type N-terminal cleavage/methylation domain-containing protein